MPTFKKGKGLRGKFNDLSNAVKDVMYHHTGLRKAGRRRNVNAMLCFIKNVKMLCFIKSL